MLLSITTNVQAITSNDVTYDNNGTTENLTESLDTLYNELKKYKTGGSVEANQMLAGVSGYSKGVLVTGTIPSKGATTYTPGTTNQTIASGQYLSGTQTIAGDADLKAENIKSGVNLFGVNGTFTSDANAVAGNILSGNTAYVNGSKVTGSMPNYSNKTTNASVASKSGNFTQINIPSNGYYDTNSKVQIDSSALLNNIGFVYTAVDTLLANYQSYNYELQGLEIGAYYLLLPVSINRKQNTGFGGKVSLISSITGATLIGEYTSNAIRTTLTDGSGDIHALVYPSIFRADSNSVSFVINTSQIETYSQTRVYLYRIF